jgi:hypothetical protein
VDAVVDTRNRANRGRASNGAACCRGSWPAPVRVWARRSRAGSGNSCRSWSEECSQRPIPRQTYGSTAVDAFTTDVVRVAELKRLLDGYALVGVVPGEVQHRDDAAKGGGETSNGQDAESGIDVGGAMENLAHSCRTRRERASPSLPENRGRLQKRKSCRPFRTTRRNHANGPLPNNVKLFTRLSNLQRPAARSRLPAWSKTPARTSAAIAGN